MDSEHTAIQEIAQLGNPGFEQSTGALLARKFERLLKRQQGELKQLQGLRWALDLLPQGPARKAIAAQILQATAEHARRAQRLAQDLLKESTPAGKQ